MNNFVQRHVNAMGRGRLRNDFIKTTYKIEEETAHLTISVIIVEVVGRGEEVDLK